MENLILINSVSVVISVIVGILAVILIRIGVKNEMEFQIGTGIIVLVVVLIYGTVVGLNLSAENENKLNREMLMTKGYLEIMDTTDNIESYTFTVKIDGESNRINIDKDNITFDAKITDDPIELKLITKDSIHLRKKMDESQEELIDPNKIYDIKNENKEIS